jgi:response regulator of citrate/malate metabolism
MITSHGEQEKVIKAIQSGASNYLLKPLKMDRLKEVLDKLC